MYNVHYTLYTPYYDIVYIIVHHALCYATERRISGQNFVRGMFLAKFEESMPDLVVNIAEFLKCILIWLIRSYLAYSSARIRNLESEHFSFIICIV